LHSPPAPRQQTKTEALADEARELLVGGVNSPVRTFGAVGGMPMIVSRAEGARVIDADGNEFLDYIGSWGAMILGHAHPDVVAAIADQAARGTSYGVTNPYEVALAREIRNALPSMERIRFVSSGTEATMSALRLARAFTGRELVMKFDGCYHGHADSFLSQAGSGLATLGIASSPGVPESLARLTLNLPYNDASAVATAFARLGAEIAAVIVEPVAANMGVVPPQRGFLARLRELTEQHKAILIFDEVITGFRVAWGGAQTLFGIQPDLTTLGKIIGGGLPVAAYGGRKDLMALVAPEGRVYQAGTFSGNPLAMRAGMETLRLLRKPGTYDVLARRAGRLRQGILAALEETGVAARVNLFGSLLTVFFTAREVTDSDSAKLADTKLFARFFREMLSRGILLPPSQFEAWFVSAAHTDADLVRTGAACRDSLRSLRDANE
jgi:glutamate-1-semialdehyde 2,1-aminomutase